MDPIDRKGSSDRSSRSTLWLTVGLVAAIAFLLLTTYSTMRSERTAESGANARLVYDTLVQARQYHVLVGIHRDPRSRPGLGVLQGSTTSVSARKLVLDMRRLATADRTARSWRKLAIVEAMVGDANWNRTVSRIPGASADEQAFWRDVLGDKSIDPARVPVYLARLAQMDLGWYRHVAAQNLYLNARLLDQAERESAKADRSFYLLTALGLVGALLSIISGLGVAVYIIVLLVQRKDPSIVLPDAVRLTPPKPLTPEQARVLYISFITYLASFIAVRYLRLELAALLPNAGRLAPSASAASGLPFLLLVIAVPLITLRVLGRPVGLRAADIGFRRGRVLSDILCGAVGWLATLPVLVTAMLISTRLFHGFESPDNPAITEYTGEHSLFIHAVLFIVAAVYAPLAEETMFRGVFLRSLTPRLGVAGAIVVASSVFALLHPQLPVGFAGIFILGVLFSLLYQARGSLVSSITAHALNNGAIFVMLTLLLAS